MRDSSSKDCPGGFIASAVGRCEMLVGLRRGRYPEGSGAPFGHNSHMRPSWRMRPASRPALRAEAPEEVGAHRPADRAARILREREPRERCGRQRPRGGEKHRRAERNRARVDGDRALRRAAARRACPAVRRSSRRASPRGGGGNFAEEHVARILVEQRAQPGPDSPCAQALIACIDARSSVSSPRSISTRRDRAVRMAVLVGVVRARITVPSVSAMRPEPWISRKNASTGSATYASALPASGGAPRSISARVQ